MKALQEAPSLEMSGPSLFLKLRAANFFHTASVENDRYREPSFERFPLMADTNIGTAMVDIRISPPSFGWPVAHSASPMMSQTISKM